MTKFNIWRERTDVFENISAVVDATMNLTGVDNPEQLQAARVTASMFPLFGLPIAHGRAFTEDESPLVTVEDNEPGDRHLPGRRQDARPNVGVCRHPAVPGHLGRGSRRGREEGVAQLVGQLGAEAVALGACTLVVDELLANGGIPPALGQNKHQALRLG